MSDQSNSLFHNFINNLANNYNNQNTQNYKGLSLSEINEYIKAYYNSNNQ